MSDKSLVPVNPFRTIAKVEPTVEATPQGAANTMIGIAWKAAEHVVQSTPELVAEWPEFEPDEQAGYIRSLWKKPTFRAEVAATMVNVFDATLDQFELAQMLFVSFVKESGVSLIEGFDTVQAWLFSQLEDRREGGRMTGQWYDYARLAETVMPFCRDNLAEQVPPEMFLDKPFLEKARAAITVLEETVKHPNHLYKVKLQGGDTVFAEGLPDEPPEEAILRDTNRADFEAEDVEDVTLEWKRKNVLHVLELAADPQVTQTSMRESFHTPRHEPAGWFIASEGYVVEDRRVMVICLPLGPAGDGLVEFIRRKLGRRLQENPE